MNPEKSTPGVDVYQRVTSARMDEILQLPDIEAEEIIFNRLQYIDKMEKLTWGEVGIFCRAVKAYEWHLQRTDPATQQPCSWHLWVCLAAPWSHSKVFDAVRDVEDLKDISDEHLVDIPKSTMKVMKDISTQVRKDPKVLSGAKSKSTDDFVEQIRTDHPEQHIEHQKPLRFNPPESDKQTIIEILNEAKIRGEVKDNNGALLFALLEAKKAWEREDRERIEDIELREMLDDIQEQTMSTLEDEP